MGPVTELVIFDPEPPVLEVGANVLLGELEVVAAVAAKLSVMVTWR